MKKTLIASDHRGVKLKSFLLGKLSFLEDLGTHDEKIGVDYPDYAAKLAKKINAHEYERGILLCHTGVGMSMVANKFPGVRAALATSEYMAEMSRKHNDANVLVLPGGLLEENEIIKIIDTWMKTDFEGGRHQLRVSKINFIESGLRALHDFDPELAGAIHNEITRQEFTLEMIASENFVSPLVLTAQGTVLTNKYAEGYPGKRYYGGCEYVDVIERLAIDRAKELFHAEAVNVQPHSGSQANMASYLALIKPGDTILGMNLSHGGHLTHGSPVNFSGQLFNVVSYGVDREGHRIDFDEVRSLAKKNNPKLIIAGASAYPRTIDFKKFRDIADEVGAGFLVDMAHIAGLVAADCHPSPIPHAHIVTTTTHKTLRGPRAGLILMKQEFEKAVNSKIFPGIQGGPLMHVIAGKAVALKEALLPEFKTYQKQIIKNAKILAEALLNKGYDLVSGGTDNHLVLVNLTKKGLTGKEAEGRLEHAGITVNKNTIPFETQSPFITSGIRIGVPAITTRGMKETEILKIVDFIDIALSRPQDAQKIKQKVVDLCKQFPLYSHLLGWPES